MTPRDIPSIDRLLQEAGPLPYPRAAVRDASREAARQYRQEAGSGPAGPWIQELARALLQDAFDASLRRVVNATGVVLHTNLGRAPLSPPACAAVMDATAYCNLELDLTSGRRGHRSSHTETLLRDLTGAPASLVVNNGAAAVLLMLDALARDREVVVSRGELIEIGGSFRLPDVLRQSGARIVEVGTTNKTYAADYAQAMGPSTGLLLKSHRSNFRMLGFTHDTSCQDLAALGDKAAIPVAMDLGSGLLLDLRSYGLGDEPTVSQVVASGIGLVCFSGDKLLGGPQAGVIVGRDDLVARCRRHPLMRALRVDKLTLAALEGTLRAYQHPDRLVESIPTLRMLTMTSAMLRQEADALAAVLRGVVGEQAAVLVEEGTSQMGGGTLPARSLPTWGVAVRPVQEAESHWENRLRLGHPAVVCRLRRGALWLDPRTLQEGDRRRLADAFTKVVQA